MSNLYYEVIRLDTSKGLDKNELTIGDGNYIFLQNMPLGANVEVRINSNFNPPIKLIQNSGIEAENIQKIYITCNAVAGELVFIHSKSSKKFRYIPATEINNKIDIGVVDEIKVLDKILGFDANAELKVNVTNQDLDVYITNQDLDVNITNQELDVNIVNATGLTVSVDEIENVKMIETVNKFSNNLLQSLCNIVNPYEFKGIDLYAFNTNETSYSDLTTVIEYENCPYDKLDFDVILYPKFNEAGYRDYYNAYFEILMNDSVLESVDLGYQTAYYTQQNTVFTLDNMLGKNIKVKLINKTSDSQYTYTQDIRVNIKKYNYKVDCINNYTNDVYNITGNTGSMVISPEPPSPPPPPPTIYEVVIPANELPLDLTEITTFSFNMPSYIESIESILSAEIEITFEAESPSGHSAITLTEYQVLEFNADDELEQNFITSWYIYNSTSAKQIFTRFNGVSVPFMPGEILLFTYTISNEFGTSSDVSSMSAFEINLRIKYEA